MNQEYKIFKDFNDLGNFLKDRRKTKGLSLKEISKTILIKEDILITFEKGNIDIENFNSSTHLKGFLNTTNHFKNSFQSSALQKAI